MELTPTLLATVVAAFVILVGMGMALGWALHSLRSKKVESNAQAKYSKLVHNAKSKAQEELLTAKEKAMAIIDEAKKEEQERRLDIAKLQERLETRENMFDERLVEVEAKKEALAKEEEIIEETKAEIAEVKQKQITELEQVSGMEREAAEQLLMTRLEEEIGEALSNRVEKLERDAKEVYDEKARELLTLAIHRCGLSHHAETTSTVVRLPSDEMKGRIIGKEGRNIRTIEELTGVEIIVDETPESILVSGFSPIRRHVAKRSLETLMEDGRIHPARIEEVVESTKKQLAEEMRIAGREALREMGMPEMDPKLMQILGRLRYRTSYGQNVLRHCIEVGTIAGLIAEQMGANVAMARKAGLFHDVGKALDHDIQGTHCEIGRDIGRKFGFSGELSDAAFCHHDDHPPTVEGVIVKIADAISGGRPGARKDSYEKFIQRMEELEDTASDFEGVKKAYAIQAGREVRVIVEPKKIDDYQAYQLAKDVAKRIEGELQYPGEIKVNVIRETRVIEYAR